MKATEFRAQHLFLLMINIAQSRDQKKAVDLFLGSLSEIWEDISAAFLQHPPEDKTNCLEISIFEKIYGYLCVKQLERFSESDRSLLLNAATMLALILENLDQNTLLADEKKHLQQLIEERTKKLYDSEERFRRITENAKDLIFHLSLPDGQYEYLSASCLELTGYPPEAFYENSALFQNVLHPAWREYFKNEWNALIQGKAAPTYEYQIIHKSGDTRWFNQRNVLIKDSEGNPIALEGIVTDISEDKRRQEEIQKAKEQLEEAQQLAKIGHWEWNMKTNVAQWSDQTYRNYGLEPQSVPIDYDFFRSFIVEEDRAFEEAESIKLMNLEIPFYNLDLRIRRADGKAAVMNTYGKIHFDDQGQPVRMAGTIQDITERKRAEALARENEMRFLAVFNSNADAQLLIGVDPDERFVVKEVNKAFLREASRLGFNITREDCIGVDLIQITASNHPLESVHLKDLLDHYRKVLKSKKGISYENVVEGRKGKIYTHLTMTPILGADQQIRYIFHSSHDITLHKKADLELRKKQQFIESIVNLTPDILYIYDLIEKKNIYSNNGIQTVLGYSVEEIQKMGAEIIPKLMHPSDLKAYLHETLPKYQTAKDGDFIEHQFRMKHKSGNWHFLECKEIIYLRLEDGSPKQIFGVIHDITHRKQAEKAVRASEKKYRQLFNSMIDGYALHEIICNDKGHPVDYRFLDINPAFEKLTGLKKAAIIGRTVLEVLPDTEPIWIEKYGKVALTGESLSFSSYSAGLRKYYSVTAFSPGKNQFAVMFVDVTEQKRAEEALRTSEQQLSIASQITKVGYWEYESEKDLFMFTDHFYKIFRTTAEEAGGYQMSSRQYAQKFVPPDDWDVVLEEKRKTRDTTDPNYTNTLEHRMIYSDGEIGYISVSIFVVKDFSGKTIKTYGVSQDITERIKLQNQIKKELREKEILLREVHHRVKNNLNVITSLLGLQEAKIKNRKQALEAFEESRNRVFSMAMVHEQLYRSSDFSQIDMKPYIEQMTHQLMFANMLKEKIDVSIRVEEVYLGINSAIPCGLILNEMISNALKHAFKGREKGQIKITFKILKDNTCSLIVKDDGVGLPDNFDVKTSQTMGFQLMRILAQQLEGELVVKQGKGTTLIVTFPQES